MAFGNAVLDLSGYTLVNRLVPDHLAGRAWGAFHAVGAAVDAAGSLAAPALVQLLGLGGAMLLTGLLLAAAPVLTWRPLARLDDVTGGRSADVELLRRVRLFAAMSLVGVERLARAAVERRLPAGTDVVRQGEPGTGFFVLTDGAAAVLRDGREVRRLGPADAFGEIALLESVPRTATVTTVEPSRLLELDRDGFVAAVTGHRPTDDLARREVALLRTADDQRDGQG